MGAMKKLYTERMLKAGKALDTSRFVGRLLSSPTRRPLNGPTTSGLPTGGRRGASNGASPVAGGQKARSGFGRDVKERPDGVLLP